MRSVFTRGLRLAVVCLLVVILLAPSAFATTAATDPGLWAQFTAWLQGRIGIPPGVTANEDGFTMWLMGRIDIPNG